LVLLFGIITLVKLQQKKYTTVLRAACFLPNDTRIAITSTSFFQ